MEKRTRITFAIDADLLPNLSKEVNKTRTINDALRQHLNKSDAPSGEITVEQLVNTLKTISMQRGTATVFELASTLDIVIKKIKEERQ